MFGVGASVPAGATVTSQPDTARIRSADTLATLGLLAGVAFAFGGLLSERFIWTTDPLGARRGPAIGAAVLALVGALAGVALAIRRAAALDRPDRWADVLTSRADRANVATLVFLSLTLLLVQRQRMRTVALLPLAGAIVIVAVRGHAPEANEWWATPAAAAHILVAGAWVGALAHLAFIARANAASEPKIEPGPSRYISRYWYVSITEHLNDRVTIKVGSLQETLSVFVQNHQTAIVTTATVVVSLAAIGAQILKHRRRSSP